MRGTGKNVQIRFTEINISVYKSKSILVPLKNPLYINIYIIPCTIMIILFCENSWFLEWFVNFKNTLLKVLYIKWLKCFNDMYIIDKYKNNVYYYSLKLSFTVLWIVSPTVSELKLRKISINPIMYFTFIILQETELFLYSF